MMRRRRKCYIEDDAFTKGRVRGKKTEKKLTNVSCGLVTYIHTT